MLAWRTIERIRSSVVCHHVNLPQVMRWFIGENSMFCIISGTVVLKDMRHQTCAAIGAYLISWKTHLASRASEKGPATISDTCYTVTNFLCGSFHIPRTSTMPLMTGLTMTASRRATNSKPSPATNVTYLLGVFVAMVKYVSNGCGIQIERVPVFYKARRISLPGCFEMHGGL